MAGRIPQHFIDDLLARINIVDVVDGRVKLKRAGKNYSGLCPFHKEKSPSFSVSPDKQFYYCFGCGAGGNALGFLMEYDRLNFPEAVEELAKLAGMEVPREEGRQIDHQREQQLKRQFEVLEQANTFFQQQLRQSTDRQRAVSYLKQRGLSGQIAAAFGIGYAPPGWDNLLRHFDQVGNATALLEQSGMVIHNEDKQSHYDRFRDRIMFPIRDVRGRVIGFGGRVLGDDKPKYLNSPETPTFHKGRELYGLYEARKHSNHLDRLLIVEGYMDVVSLAQHGIHWSVATLGTATTAQHLERLFKLVPEVIFCFDGDQAGRTAARRALNTALPVIKDGQEARFLFLPDGEDPDTLVRKEGEAAFSERVSQALPLSEFFFKSMSEEADLTSMDGRARFSNTALPLINSMQPSLLKQMMLDRICDITGLSLEQLSSVIDLHQATHEPAPSRFQSTASAERHYDPREYASHDHYDDSNYGYDNYAETQIRPDHSAPRSTPRPRTASANSPGNQGSRNLVNQAVSILLHRPELAHSAPAADSFRTLLEPNIEVLINLLDYLQKDPSSSLGTLLVDWQDAEEHRSDLMLLNEISHLDPILGDVDAASLLDDTLKRLLARRQEAQLDQLLKKSRQSPLTDEEKRDLQQLLLNRQH
ncbi:DNA primase [Marinobacterium sediminicola]|uniref:DNA primase n=1 Tax=Marinobacterium sediminicola TaxID=518898 RepID=A0ABY1RYE2_9GAMM|nr:DNA primase [Marinobacterium sediminicola]ULG68719.1 DNA primase [Marinobacterium sediminicola]SMR73245.1 DNA primase [Marinobacterium sediminicola]